MGWLLVFSSSVALFMLMQKILYWVFIMYSLMVVFVVAQLSQLKPFNWVNKKTHLTDLRIDFERWMCMFVNVSLCVVNLKHVEHLCSTYNKPMQSLCQFVNIAWHNYSANTFVIIFARFSWDSPAGLNELKNKAGYNSLV